jgi:pyridoxamine---pyruvate transaminase
MADRSSECPAPQSNKQWPPFMPSKRGRSDMSPTHAENRRWPAGHVFTLSAGPSGASPAVLAALGSPIISEKDPEFLEIYASTVEKLVHAFGAPNSPVILPAEAVLGLEAASAALIKASDVVLNLVSGVYGKFFGYWARRYTERVIDLTVPFNSSIDAAQVRNSLMQHPDVTLVAAVHCETPSGTVNPIIDIGNVVHEHGALFLVDAVSSFGGMEVNPAQWWADVVVVGSQKCLGGPAGLSLVYLSDDAWKHIEANPKAPRASILSLLDWRDADGTKHPFPFTPSISEIRALDVCLQEYLEEGPEAVRGRHALVAEAARDGGEALGLSLWPADRAICSNTVTAYNLPPGIAEDSVITMARRDSGVMLSGGEDVLEGKVIRLGHMGPSAYPLNPVVGLTALGRALRAAGFSADIGAAVEAASRVLDHGQRQDQQLGPAGTDAYGKPSTGSMR